MQHPDTNAASNIVSEAGMASLPAHSSPTAALLFMYARSSVNRMKAQLARLRSPRYIIAVVVGIAYIYWAFIGSATTENGALRSVVANPLAEHIVALFLLIASARWWLFGKDRGALAFSPAEVQFLFPAPLTRRTLIHAKLLRTQVSILLNTLIWVVLLRGDATSSMGWQRGFALWLLFSTLALHRLGATIVRVNALEHSAAGWRRSLAPIAVFLCIVGAVLFGLLSQLDELRHASSMGIKSLFTAVTTALQQTVPSVALWPVRALLQPAFAANSEVWLKGIPWAAIVFAVHYLWVIKLDGAFEEAALEASQNRAQVVERFRSAQLGQLRSSKGKLARVPSLRISGRPEVAITWKNIAAAIRGGTWRTQLVAFTLGLTATAVAVRMASPRAGDVFIAITAAWGAMLLFLGPVWMRFDLRLDLQQLSVLKSFPLSGTRIVLAEIAAVTILHSITVWSLMTVPVVLLLTDSEMAFNFSSRLTMIASVAIAVPAMNALMFTIQNGIALLFPAWVRLGTETRGFETMGQNLLTSGLTIVIASVALVFPAGIGALIAWIGRMWMGDVALLVGVFVGAIIVGLQLWPVIYWLGRVLDRTEVSDVAANS